MKRQRGRIEQARQTATYTDDWRERQARVLIEVRADPRTETKRKAKARNGVKRHHANKRGGLVPEGYEAEYHRLRVTKKIPAAESLTLVRAQRGADLRSS